MTPQQRATEFMRPMKSGGVEASNRRFQLDEADVERVIQDALDEEGQEFNAIRDALDTCLCALNVPSFMPGRKGWEEKAKKEGEAIMEKYPRRVSPKRSMK